MGDGHPDGHMAESTMQQKHPFLDGYHGEERIKGT